MNSELGIGEAAKILGISTSTLKRLCDQQLIPSLRTPGGHRRFVRQEIEMAGQRLLGRTMELADRYSSTLKDRFSFLMLAGNEVELVRLISQESETLGLPAVMDDYLIPAISDVLTDEPLPLAQLAYEAAINVAHRLELPLQTQPNQAAQVIGGSVGQWSEELPSKLIEVLFRSNGIAALHMETLAAPNQLIEAAQFLKVRAVWLATLTSDAIGPLTHFSQSLRDQLPAHVRVIIYCAAHHSFNTSSWAKLGYYTSLRALLTHESQLPQLPPEFGQA